MPPSGSTPAERAIAVAIFAPIGLGAKVADDLPDLVAKARQQLVFARFVGKMAVERGVNDLRDRIADLGTAEASTPAAATSGSHRAAGEADVGVGSPSAPISSSVELALPDYDQLAATHILSKLAGLTGAELDAIEAYESAHRHRRTVLGKITQLRGN